VAKHLSLRRKI